jgi:AhpD family alkylhydroperoxidase
MLDVTGDNTSKIIIEKTTNGKNRSVFQDMEKTLGIVPEFFKMMPPTHLEHEWHIFKTFQLGDQTALEPKMKELIGLAAAATLHCKYCTYFHTVAAAMNGATPEELNETLLMAKHTAGWSSYLTGARYDIDLLKREMQAIKKHVQSQQRA